jgi:hypothetical protein
MKVSRGRISQILLEDGTELSIPKDAIYNDEGKILSIVSPTYSFLNDQEMLKYFEPLHLEGFIEKPEIAHYNNGAVAYVNAKVIESFQNATIGAYLTMLDYRGGGSTRVGFTTFQVYCSNALSTLANKLDVPIAHRKTHEVELSAQWNKLRERLVTQVNDDTVRLHNLSKSNSLEERMYEAIFGEDYKESRKYQTYLEVAEEHADQAVQPGLANDAEVYCKLTYYLTRAAQEWGVLAQDRRSASRDLRKLNLVADAIREEKNLSGYNP